MQDYEDKEVIKYLHFGWPINTLNTKIDERKPRNQLGIMQNRDKVISYLEAELKNKSMVGPFNRNLLGREARFSPLGTRPKKDDPLQVRVILNLSHPFKGDSVNHSIDKDNYLSENIELKFPGVDQLVQIIWRKGRGCRIFKRDMTKAYRQIYIDVGQIHLVGYMVENKIFFDLTLSMGLKIAAYICQRVTDALIFIYRKTGHEGINYLDDLGGAEIAPKAQAAFDMLGKILREIGVWEAEKKACPPSITMAFLGIWLNTMTLTLEITLDRLASIKAELQKWLKKGSATLKELQSLVGKLNFAATTVHAGRLFFSRILDHMRSINSNESCPIPDEVMKDISWWIKYMKEFDGKAMMMMDSWVAPEATWSTDACETACGGWTQGQYFHAKFLDHIIQNPEVHINELECLAIVVALKLWGPRMRRKKFLVNCDNEVSVLAINSGRARNKFTQSCLREIAFLAAKNNTMIKAVHVASAINGISDALSRLHLGEKYWHNFKKLTKGYKMYRRTVTDAHFTFTN